MPTISFDLTAGEASKLTSVGIDKATVIQLVKQEYQSRVLAQVTETEQAKVKVAQTAMSDAIDATDTTVTLT